MDEIAIDSEMIYLWQKPKSSSDPVKQRLPDDLPSFSSACDHKAIFSRAGAQPGSAFLQDFNYCNTR